MGNRIKIRTLKGKIITILVEKEDSNFIEGKDKDGSFVKINKLNIEESVPVNEDGK